MKLRTIRNRRINRCIVICAAAVVCCSAANAHHSAVAFDKERTVDIAGTVTRLVWRNPHVAVVMDVENENGDVEVWRLEGNPPRQWISNGVRRDSIAVGTTLQARVNPMKSGEPGGLVQGLTLADGTSFGMEDYGDGDDASPANRMTRERRLPSLTEYVPPPDDESWEQREQRTRPSELPLARGRLGVGSQTGALDPENLARDRPEPPFDLTGTWEFRGEVEEQDHYGQYEFKPLPQLTEQGKRFHDEYLRYARAGQRYAEPTAECYPAGMPRLMTRYGSLMMLQYPTAIFMLSRLNNEYRVVFLDGRERLPADLREPSWNGESLGHWEGDTLVVETEGFVGDNHLIQQGIVTGEQLKVTERITMLNDGNTLKIDFILTDPEHWIGEWRHTKFRDRILNYDVREANCLNIDNQALPGMRQRN
ncbi:MAG: DUF6152 family protein [Pseudomonadota bacterium]